MAIQQQSATHEPTRQRSIDYDRFGRAVTEPMSVRFIGPSIGGVTHDGATYQVELESGACECDDYRFRGERLICKHVQRACLSALYTPDQRVTELVARVARFTRHQECVHDVYGCAGPTTAGPRGLPCQQCIDRGARAERGRVDGVAASHRQHAGGQPMNCSQCGGPLEVVDVSAGETTAFERYECADCGGTGTYVNEFGVPGGGVRTSGVVER